MNDEKKEKVNNWVRRNFNFSTIMAFIILIGIIATFISNVRSIPILRKDIRGNAERVEKNTMNVALLQKDIQYIREGIASIKRMIKEDRRK